MLTKTPSTSQWRSWRHVSLSKMTSTGYDSWSDRSPSSLPPASTRSSTTPCFNSRIRRWKQSTKTTEFSSSRYIARGNSSGLSSSSSSSSPPALATPFCVHLAVAWEKEKTSSDIPLERSGQLKGNVFVDHGWAETVVEHSSGLLPDTQMW